MKKRFCALLLVLALCLSLIPAAVAAGGTTVVLKIGCNQMAVGTQVVQVDDRNAAVCPIAENNRTLVPVSRIVAAFGGKSTWDAATNATTFTLNGKTVSHVIGTNTVTTPTGTKTMEVSSKAMNNRTYVPARYILEGLGLNVGYEGTQQLVVASANALNKDGLLELPEAKALLNAQGRSAIPASNYTAGNLVASARSKAEMEPKYDGATVQDLPSATGFLFTYNGENEMFNHCVIYSYPENTSREKILSELTAYVDLLSARPGFELVKPWGRDGDFGDYFADLNYTGSAARMKGNITSQYGDWDAEAETVHVEISWSEQWGEVTVFLDDNLKYEDLGLRTPGGAGLTTFQVSGDRAGDAYYCDNGTYYNAGDKKLSTVSGKAALLIDGKSYTAAVKFETVRKDGFSLSGYYRNDKIEISLPRDWAAAGDVYGLDSLRYGRKESTWGPFVCVEYDNANQWAIPLADPEQQVTEATVRVLRWDKSGSGDTVLYFHMKAEIQGKTYEIEGLAAVPWKDPNAPSQQGSGAGSVLDKKDCSACSGSGRCRACGGTGRVRNSMAGTGKWLEQDCIRCSGSGRCRDCNGTGKR